MGWEGGVNIVCLVLTPDTRKLCGITRTIPLLLRSSMSEITSPTVLLVLVKLTSVLISRGVAGKLSSRFTSSPWSVPL